MAARTPISVAQFAEFFRRAWMAPLGPRGGISVDRSKKHDGLDSLPRRLGLAVSGGADSMALAYLCRQLELSGEPGALSVTAFVVDHRARPESSDEANTVAGWLRDLGLNTKVLKLDWSAFSVGSGESAGENVAISMPSAFETHARRLRFQALGRACQQSRIRTLLMGHHQDDTVETMIWRLSAGARGAGLAGIPEVARIPECHGLYGVAESGSPMKLAAKQGFPQIQVRLEDHNSGKIIVLPDSDKMVKPQNPKAVPLESIAISVANGGVLTCRPLLSFPKARLVATCFQNNIPYVSDPTNFDPTLTPRNAIRSLLASNTLPRALQPPSILSLVRSSQELLQTSSELSDQLLSSRCRVLDFNPRAGTMVVQFNDKPAPMGSEHNGLSETRLRQIQAIAIRRITELISPFPGSYFSLRSFQTFTTRLFPENGEHGNQASGLQANYLNGRRPFTVGGVMFHPLTVDTKKSKDVPPSEQNVWLLSRQPFMKNRAPTTRLDVPFSTPKKPQQPRKSGAPESRLHTPWTLWDDRYWFRFSIVPSPANKGKWSEGIQMDGIPLVIRPFNKNDLLRIRDDPGTLAGEEAGRVLPRAASVAYFLRPVLLEHAPGATRFTLPVLALGEPCESGQASDGAADQLLALPTLNYRLSGRNLGNEAISVGKTEIYHAQNWWIVKWEWMYKMVDTEALRLMNPVGADMFDVHNNKV